MIPMSFERRNYLIVIDYTFILFFLLLVLSASISIALGESALLLIFLGLIIAVGLVSGFIYKKEMFWVLYYVVLTCVYIITGYFGDVLYDYESHLAVKLGRWFVGAVQLFPFFVLTGLMIANFKHVINSLHKLWPVALLIIYLILRVGEIDQTFFVQIRNFCGIFVAYILGKIVAPILDIRKFFKYILIFAIFVCLFGFFEYVFRLDFWVDMFPARYVSELKAAGTFANGVIGNKLIGINGVLFYRMSSVFYAPPHAAYNFVFFTLMFWSLFSSRIIVAKQNVIPFLVGALFLSCVVLSFIKAAWGQFAIAAFFMTITTKKTVSRWCRNISKTRSLIILISAIGGGILLLILYLGSGITSTARAHLAATLVIFDYGLGNLVFGKPGGGFNVLNSDSGVATIIFTGGLVGYAFVLIGLTEIVRQILKNRANGRAGFAIVGLIAGWFTALHFTSSAWSPMGNFILFFSAGLLSSRQAFERLNGYVSIVAKHG